MSKYRKWTSVATSLVLSVATATGGEENSSSMCSAGHKQPNIVWILTDDLGWGDLGCFGHPVVNTPSLDRLASEGCRLTRFYVPMPICSPSRAGALTGRDPNRYGMLHVINQGMVNPRVTVPEVHHLPVDEPLLPKVLQAAGYRTGAIGKWHLSLPGIASEPKPVDYGFDHYFIHNGGGNLYRGPATWDRNGEAVAVGADKWFADVYVNEAKSFIESTGDRPFYLQLWPFTPHVTEDAREDYRQQYRDRTSQERTYFGCITQLDAQLGVLLAYLKERGLSQNTIVIFSSDNGPEPPVNIVGHEQARRGSTGGLRGAKHVLYEGGIRVPAIICWPGVTKPGSECATLLSALDFMPTLARAAGSSPPAGWAYDGTDMRPALIGRAINRPHPLFWKCEYAQNTFMGPHFKSLPLAIRDGSWKLMSDSNYKQFELFNLDTDPGEQFNIAAEHPDQVQSMVASLRGILTDVDRPQASARHLNAELLKDRAASGSR